MRRAREERGLSLDELTRATKIGKATLIALESTDVARLPAAIYTRGFIKSYAKEIGLDPDLVANEYLTYITPRTTPDVAENAGSRLPVAGQIVNHGVIAQDDTRQLYAVNHVRHFSRVTTLAAVVGLIVYVVSFNRQAGNDESRIGSAYQRSQRELRSANITEADRADAHTKGTADAVSMKISGPLTLELVPQGPCWLVATVDGQRVVARLMQPGERQTLEVAEEALLRVGDPGALSISINGQNGRVLGRPGQPVDVKITKDNFKEFLSS